MFERAFRISRTFPTSWGAVRHFGERGSAGFQLDTTSTAYRPVNGPLLEEACRAVRRSSGAYFLVSDKMETELRACLPNLKTVATGRHRAEGAVLLYEPGGGAR